MIEEKVSVAFNEKLSLDGILSLPDNPSALVPAAVFVHGSGPNDRDETIGKTKLFKDLATAFAAAGIASLRYDKRTKVYPQSFMANPAATIEEETIQDALTATALVKNDKRINREKVFIVGHSMGGGLAPRIDAEGGDFAGLIILSGSPRRLEDIILSQNEAALSHLDAATQETARLQIVALKAQFAAMYQLTDEAAQAQDILPNVKAYYFKEWGEKPVEQYLRELTKPVFVAQGEADFQISVEKDFKRWQELLANNPKVTFKLYHNLTHVFTPS